LKFVTLLTVLTAISIGCGASASPAARSPFVGDWKLNKSRSSYTDVMKVKRVDGNTYTFDFGGGSETIVADGTDQPGTPGTTLSVVIEGRDSWKVVRKQSGHLLISAMWKLSDDGNTLSDDYTQYAPNEQVSLHARYAYKRIADGSGFAGTWESPIALDGVPPTTLQIRPYDADGLSFIRPSLQVTKNLELDGKDYPVVGAGAGAGATSSARRVDEHTLELVDKTKGEIRKTDTLELSSDLGTLTQTSHPVGQRGPNVFVFERCASGGCS
jgi:hypothetical protein